MRKLAPITMLAWTLCLAALAPAKEPEEAAKRKMLPSTLSKNPMHSDAAQPHRRAARRAMEPDRTVTEAAQPSAGASPQLEAIAACESGGDPAAVSSNGAYRGKYQFSPATWQAVGGQGDPAAAPEAEQDRRAAMLVERSGPGQWPACGG